MSSRQDKTSSIWDELKNQAQIISRPDKHLKHLTVEKNRLPDFSRSCADFLFDFSRQRLDYRTIELLLELAEIRGVQEKFISMTNGGIVNTTEKRAALHTATRDFSDNPVVVDGSDIMPEIRRVRNEIEQFARQVHDHQIVGSTGRPFEHLVVIGIGGSYLGTEFVARALTALADKKMSLHFLANVDIHNFGEIVASIDPETTLWLVVSKSFTTAETMANTRLAYDFMKREGVDPARQVVSITSAGSPGDAPEGDVPFTVLRSFHMFDFIGGRYSVTSAVGGVPLSLYLGYDRFLEFMQGAQEMDIHAKTASPRDNLPLLAALISLWNNNFLGYTAQAIIPYASPLDKLAPHVQQLYMESNGKSVTTAGQPITEKTGLLIFGEPGTNAQHSFFQLAHQGNPFPIDFIGVIQPQYNQYQSQSKGVTNHQELWANLISQPRALAEGKSGDDPHRNFSGNRPSSTIILKDLSPKNVGRLLAFYEARTVYEAFLWGINPFDQFGVELGKVLATETRDQIKIKNQDHSYDFNQADPITKFYLETLLKN